MIIGVVAAITVPMILNHTQEQEFKSAYKKAHADLTNAVLKSIAFGEFPFRDKKRDEKITLQEWEQIKKSFIITKTCNRSNFSECWKGKEEFWSFPNGSDKREAFIDSSGRVWAQLYNIENFILVDTNGNRKPNRAGKDIFFFTFVDEKGNRICGAEEANCSNPGVPSKIAPAEFKDWTRTNQSTLCPNPPCYYKSWLLN